MTEDEWNAYEQYWLEDRHVVRRDEFVLGHRLDADETKYAWAAGFLDGEGCFQAHPTRAKGASLCIELAASQVNPNPLRILVQLYGGSLCERKKTLPERDIWKWSIQSARSLRVILPTLIPYLIGKKREAEKLLELAHLVGGKGRHSTINEPGNVEKRLELVAELARLKRGKSWV